jgi:hypothetical protein
MATTVIFSDSSGDTESLHSATNPIPQAARRIGADFAHFWTRSAPQAVVESYGRDGDIAGWRAWSRYLAKRPRQLPKLTSRQQLPLAWGIADESLSKRLTQFVERTNQLSRLGSEAQLRDRSWLEQWLGDAEKSSASLTYALECLAIGHALPKLAPAIAAETWWKLAEHLWDAIHLAAAQSMEATADADLVVTQQLLAGELPLVLSSQFPEVEPLRGLRDVARNSLSEAIIELTDGKGLPHARQVPGSRLLLACWTRSRALAEHAKRRPWSSEAETQYEWFVREAMQLTRTDGSLIFSDPAQKGWSPQLFELALRLAGNDADQHIARAILPGKVVSAKTLLKTCVVPKAAVNSEWSALALLAGQWSRSTPRLAVDYSEADLRIDLECHERLFLSGSWKFEAKCDGQRLEIDGQWDKQCWFNNKACVYLELSVPLSQGLRLERQILVGRIEPVVYLSDVLLTESDVQRRLQFVSHFPIAGDATYIPEAETFDGILASGTSQAAVLPLSLSEWRVGSRNVGFAAEDAALSLRQEVVGSALCSAVFLDFKKKRVKKQRTWRQLTVAESLEIQPRDVAVGYRIQSGKEQWLAYRSLAPARNRTVIGQNFSSEFYMGEFLTSGKVNKYLEIGSS